MTTFTPSLAGLLSVVAITAAQAQVVIKQPPSFTPLPAELVGVSPSDPRLTPVQRDNVLRFQIVDKLDLLDRDFTQRVCLPSPPTSPADIDPHRSLMVHDVSTLTSRDFSLRRTMDQLASQVVAQVPGTTAASIFRQFWDTQNPAAQALATGPRCSDAGGTLNGLPHACRPRNSSEEGREAVGTDAQINARMSGSFDSFSGYVPLALVNRLDLAHEGWRNCGEYRIVYGELQALPNARNLIIFEGVLPNPTPGCRSGCKPVMQMWKSLSAMNSATDRAAKLEEFFYTGLPGFRPVVHVDHYSSKGVTGTYGGSGSGQIRTNQFVQTTRWMLKEFKTVLNCSSTPCKFEIVPIPVKVNPWGTLWNEDVANTANPLSLTAQAFQTSVLGQTALLGDPTLMRIGYSVSPTHNAPQSFSQAPIAPPFNTMPSSQAPFDVWHDQYLAQFNAAGGSTNTFRTGLQSEAALQGLTATQILKRATTQTCAGCHQPDNFGLRLANAIGPAVTPTGTTVTSWPNSLGNFVHVETQPAALVELSNPAFASNLGHALSPALHDVFLPDRRNFLVDQLNAITCPCTHRFTTLTAEMREPAFKRQDGVLAQLVPQASAWQRLLAERLASTRPLTLAESLKLDAQRASISAQQEKSLAEMRRALGMPPIAIGPSPQPVTRDVTQEPARRTTSGSFRTH
ncbi:hypothetical protein [Piscinibacter sp. HJYY11]|uniref:hypothetical protein n=1 Tax=Piscinibacter sp. HJYY11 TaxID=2801333 RepID=UPI00191F109C|nr:hypothetical protein [Piscinibacter sp. HJYY11]MBL0729159.1 hypothetical protein [Piscinibacter sp. HJYY11]